MPITKQRGSPVIYVAGSARELPAEVQDWLGQAENRAVASPHIYDMLAQLARGKKFAAIVVNIQSVDWGEMDFFVHAARLSRHLPIYVAGPHQQRAKLEAACHRGARLFDHIGLSEDAARAEARSVSKAVAPATAERDSTDVSQQETQSAKLDERAAWPWSPFTCIPPRPSPAVTTDLEDASVPVSSTPIGGGNGHQNDACVADSGLAAVCEKATDEPISVEPVKIAADKIVADAERVSAVEPCESRATGSLSVSVDTGRQADSGTRPEVPADSMVSVEPDVMESSDDIAAPPTDSVAVSAAVATVATTEVAQAPAVSEPASPLPLTSETPVQSPLSFRLAPSEGEDEPRMMFPWSTYANRPRRTPPRSPESSPVETGREMSFGSQSLPAPGLDVRLTPEEIAALMGKAPPRNASTEAP